MKKKRINPAYLPGNNPVAWALAGRCYKQNISHKDMMMQARATPDPIGNIPYLVEQYRREFGYNQHCKSDKLKRRIAERLPIRKNERELPFYLRSSYMFVSADYIGATFIPLLEYNKLTKEPEKYEPIKHIKNRLHANRYEWLRKYSEGLIRWTETISITKCEFIVTKTFNEFYFKINAYTDYNKLPTIKKYNSVGVTIRAPREFFEQTFWGLGEHLVVRVLKRYNLDDGTKVLHTLSCDRENLYSLNEPSILKERFYVERNDMKGTGLTEQAAVRSLQYYMSKEISFALGV